MLPGVKIVSSYRVLCMIATLAIYCNIIVPVLMITKRNMLRINLCLLFSYSVGCDSSVGITTRYGMNGQGIASLSITVAERSKARVCDRSLAGVAGSNPAGGMDVCVVSKKIKCRIIKTKTSTDEVQTEYKRIQKKIPVRARFSARFQTGPGNHPASYTRGTGSLSPG